MTADRAVRFSLLEFFAGELHCAIPAAEVASLAEEDATAPHVADLLGVARRVDAPHRVVRIRTAAEVVSLIVDGPVDVLDLLSADVLAPPPAFTAGSLFPVLGFARRPDGVLLLLSAAGLAKQAAATAGRTTESADDKPATPQEGNPRP